MAGSSADLEAALTRAELLTGEVFNLASRVVDSALTASAAADVDMEEASVVGGEDDDVQMNEGELPASDKAPEAPPPEAGDKVPEVPPPGLGGENPEEKEKSTVVEPEAKATDVGPETVLDSARPVEPGVTHVDIDDDAIVEEEPKPSQPDEPEADAPTVPPMEPQPPSDPSPGDGNVGESEKPPGEESLPPNPIPPPGFGDTDRDAIRWFLQADLLATKGEPQKRRRQFCAEPLHGRNGRTQAKTRGISV